MASLHDTDRRSTGTECIQRRDRDSPPDPSPPSPIVHAAHIADAVFVRQTHGDREHARPHVEVLMPVEVLHTQPGSEHMLDLRAQFAFDGSVVLSSEYETGVRLRKAHSG